MSSSTFASVSMNSMRIGRCSVSTSIFVVCITWWAPKPAIARVAVAPDTPLCSRNVRIESHREPKWCCVSSLTKIVTFLAVPFWSMPTTFPPLPLRQHHSQPDGYVAQHNARDDIEHPGPERAVPDGRKRLPLETRKRGVPAQESDHQQETPSWVKLE